MKTITLTDDAYQRLLAWKADPKESFSKVVLKVVPKRGTLADLAAAMDKLPDLDDRQARLMEESVRWANEWGAAPGQWTT
jgi:predicted CopG family antitoxin